DFELDRGLVQPGMTQLQLPQRRPLRLADRLSRRLDGHPTHLRLAAPFFRRTRRGWPDAFDGAAFGCSGVVGFAPFPPPASSFGGARELRLNRSGGGVLGIRRRVMRPWPTVHRFVVTQ